MFIATPKPIPFNTSGTRPYVFIFWSDMFDEVMTTVLTTEIRKVGLRVELIGFRPSCITGIHGVSIKCDKTLGQAVEIADRAICVVFPCKANQITQLEDDPRVEQFLQQANQAKIVTSHLNIADLGDISLLQPYLSQVYLCPDHDGMFEFAQEFAKQLCLAVER